MLMGVTSNSQSAEYKEVRGLIRGLSLLKALNSVPSAGASTSALARACAINRTTTKRILETLRMQGVVQLGSKEGFYMLSNNVLELTSALHPLSWIPEVALPIMREATKRLRWSCDIATFRDGQMVVRESTQRWNAMHGHRALVGEIVSASQTALGQAYLAACAEPLREKLTLAVANREYPASAVEQGIQAIRDAAQQTVMRGYAVKNPHNKVREHLGAIGLPILGQTRPIAAINLVFEHACVNQEMITGYYLPELRKVAADIEQSYLDWRSKNEEQC